MACVRRYTVHKKINVEGKGDCWRGSETHDAEPPYSEKALWSGSWGQEGGIGAKLGGNRGEVTKRGDTHNTKVEEKHRRGLRGG